MSEPLPLVVAVTDDGRPEPRQRGAAAPAAGRGAGREGAVGMPQIRRESPITQAAVRLDPGVRLGVTWLFYRGGPGTVAYDPMRAPVTDGKAATRVSFSKPGVYQVRAFAHDGVLVTPATVTVTVSDRSAPR